MDTGLQSRAFLANVRRSYGQVAERLKAHAWKVCIGLTPYRGFESRPVRHIIILSHPITSKEVHQKPLKIWVSMLFGLFGIYCKPSGLGVFLGVFFGDVPNATH